MPNWPVLEVSIKHRIGVLALDIDFQLSRPWTVLFAPSGAGKTTVLKAIAGLIRAECMRIVWTETSRSLREPNNLLVLADTTKNSFIPAHARRIPMVTQNSALFPHLTVAKNVLYGLRANLGKSEDDVDTEDLFGTLLDLCRIGHLADRMPAQLSGGERQRVALARALAADGMMVLLDEPFAGIDATLKDDLMLNVKAWLQAKAVPVLHVTHDVGEVFAMADEVIVLGEGRVTGQGPPERVLQDERKRLLGWLHP